jgi:hypothetical protein
VAMGSDCDDSKSFKNWFPPGRCISCRSWRTKDRSTPSLLRSMLSNQGPSIFFYAGFSKVLAASFISRRRRI